MITHLVLATLLGQVGTPALESATELPDLGFVMVAAASALAGHVKDSCAFGAINGAQVRPMDQLRAPVSGRFWVTCFASLDAKVPASWHRFQIDSTVVPVAASIKHEIAQDLAGPALHVEWALPAALPATDARLLPSVIGPQHRIKIVGTDQSGIRETRLLVNGVDKEITAWSAGLDATPETVQLSVRGLDILGNESRIDLGNVPYDARPPVLSFRAVNTPAGAPLGLVGKPPYTLELIGTDTNAPVRLSLGNCSQNDRLTCTVNGTQSTLIGVDALGNRAELAITLDVDATGRNFTLDGQVAPLEVTMRVGDVIRIDATDASGIEKACVRFGSSCRPMPMRYRAIASGRYRLSLRATDAFGNARQQTLKVEVAR